MNAKNLPLKFTFVALLVAICLYALYAEGLQYGIDLKGGHSLIFEIRTPKAELDALNADLARQTELLAKAVTDEQKLTIQGTIKRIEGEIASQSGFGNYHHMCRAFQRREGMSPIEFRKRRLASRSARHETQRAE
jgi:AraC-like DNA-binding protein